MKLVLGIIGEIAAGKTTVTDYLKTNYRAVTFRFSDSLRDVAKRLHLEETRGNLQNLSTALRQTFGDDLLSKIIAADARDAKNDLVIIEGIRRPSDVTYLKELPGFKMVYIKTDERTRFERLTERSENADDKSKTWEQFEADGKQESEQKIKEIAAKADITIDNNGTIEQLNNQLNALLKT